jgi:hypothetical protein
VPFVFLLIQDLEGGEAYQDGDSESTLLTFSFSKKYFSLPPDPCQAICKGGRKHKKQCGLLFKTRLKDCEVEGREIKFREA